MNLGIHRTRPAWFQPRLVLLLLGLLGLLGLGASWASWQGWGWYHYRAAERARAGQDYQQEREHLRQCLRVWGSSAELHLLAARAARRAQDFEAARTLLKQCEKLHGPAEDIDLERILLGLQGRELSLDHQELLALVRGLRTDLPAADELLEAVCKDYLDSYRFAEARACLDLWLERDPQSVRALLWSGWLHERSDVTVQPALHDYRQAAAFHPEHDEAVLRLAEALMKAKQPDEALPHLEWLRGRQPDNPLVLLDLALCQEELGDAAEAKHLLDGLLGPERLAVVERWSERLRAAQPVEEELAATEWVRQALALAPFDSAGRESYAVDLFIQALIARGKLAQRADDEPRAEACFRLAVKLDPYDPAANYQLLLWLERRGEKEEVRRQQARMDQINADGEQMQQVIQKITDSPHDPALRCVAGEVLGRNGQPREAMRWLESALREDPRHAHAHQLLADLYERAGDSGRAAEHRKWAREPIPSTRKE